MSDAPHPTPAPAGRPTRPARAAGHGAAFLESRRFRTWESDTHPTPASRWGVVLRYALLRTVRTWYLGGLLAIAAISGVATLMAMSYDAINGTGVDIYYAGMAVFAYVPALLLLFVGSPMFAEDVRFNAPLFYFSRPLRSADYVLGKCLHLFGLMAATGLLPLVLLAVMVLAIGVHDVSPTDTWSGQPRSAAEMAEARLRAVDTYGDALYAGMVTVLGSAAVLYFATSAMVLCSAYTRRAWHAAMAFVAILGSWSMLGAFVTELLRGATQHLFGPVGWMFLAIGMPLDLRFADVERYSPHAHDGAWFAIPMAYLLLLGLGTACLAAASHRMRKLEALL